MNEEEDTAGPFITVVSVDGGLTCGNKLTVITPTGIPESSKKGNNSAANNKDDRGEFCETTHAAKESKLRIPCHKGKVSAIPLLGCALVGVDRKPNSGGGGSGVRTNNTDNAAYVTLVSFEQEKEIENAAKLKSGIPVKSLKNYLHTKSIVQLGNKEHNAMPRGNPSPGKGRILPDCEEDQIITISNKVKGGHGRNSSFVEISSKEQEDEKKCNFSNWQQNEDVEIPTLVIEQVTILRLPGEKLGFGLRFEGGVTNPVDKVRNLFIQSCAFDSPSIKAQTSWGHLDEGDEILEIESLPVTSMTRMECIQRLKDSSVAVRLLISHFYTGEELSLLRAQREIALQKRKLKTASTRSHPSQNKAEGEITLKIKNGSELKEKTCDDDNDDAINNKANDSCKPHHVHGLNQQITSSRRETISLTSLSSSSSTVDSPCPSKIPLPKSKQSLPLNTNSNNANNLDTANNTTTNSHEQQSGNSIVYDHNKNEIEQGLASNQIGVQHDEDETQQQLMRLKPPVGFADELLPQPTRYHHQSTASLEGCNKTAKGVQSSYSNKNFYLHHQQQPSEPQFYHNAISPTHSYRNSSMSLESFGSDETGSSRSTVVSRLSMTSSITSTIGNGVQSDNNLMATSPTSNPNPHNGGHHVLLVKRKSSLSSLNSCPEGVALVVDGETNFQNEKFAPSATLAETKETGIGTVGQHTPDAVLSFSGEIPLAPPLVFQDQSNNNKQQQALHVIRDTAVCYSGFNPQKIGKENIHNSFRRACGDDNLQANEPDSGEQHENGAKKAVSCTTAEGARVRSAFTFDENKSMDEFNVLAANGNHISPDFTAANWEQKGILDYDDDDDLALLAEELGLDQDDEDLFNSLVAEIDEISAQVVGSKSLVNNKDDGKRSDIDELLIQQNFNGAEFTERHEFKNFHSETAHHHGQHQQQQHHQLCATSSFYEKGDGIRDANIFSTNKNNTSRQKTTSCHAVDADENRKTNESNGRHLENKDGIEFESSDNGDLLTANKDRLFPPFSPKVVEPINGEIMMTINKKEAEDKQMQFQQWKKEGCFEKEDDKTIITDAGNFLKTETTSAQAPAQAPAPPPRTKVLEKRVKENQKTEPTSPPRAKVRKNIASNKRDPASPTIVKIDEWSRPEGVTTNFNSVKLQVRQHNSSLVCSETKETNPESSSAAAASVICRKEGSDGDNNGDFDDSQSSHKGRNLVIASHSAQQGVTTGDQAAEQITLPPKRMDSTEVLHSHHQFPPPTFSRLPPDGHEFPNNYWSDEKIIQFSGDDKCQFRNEYSVGTSSKPSSEPGSPPPLPTSEPPKEDPIEFPPLPNTVPPVPPKKMAAAQRYSFDDRKKLFESSPSSAKDMINTNGFTYPAKPSEEPSKKNVAVQPALPCHTVKDKIAMFSSRSNSSEDSDSLQSILPKKISNHVSSSLSKSTVHIPNSNGFSKSSENLLGTTTTGRKGSVDLSLAAHRDTTPPVPLYATMTRVTPNSTAKPLSLYERSQSMVDVGGADLGGKNASYQNSVNQSQPYTSNQYGSSTLGKPVVVSNMMEQRRKCMTKLRGLVIPDGPTDGTNSAAESGSMRTRTCASVMDLPTIKPASLYPATDNSQLKKSISRTESLDRFSSSIETTSSFTKTNCSNNNNNNNNNDNQSAKTNSALQQTEYTSNGFPNILPKYSPAFKRRGLSTYQPSTTTTLPSKISPPTTNKQTPGTTPEPKSLESLTSPKSDSSFEFSSSVSQQQQNHQRQKNTPPTGGVKSMEKPVEIKVGKEQTVKTNNNLKVVNGKSGKLEDSDNDSAVSSSRSSISHGLSPPNSPTPGESTAATPDPDLGSDDQKNEEVMMNMDESWRVLKPTSVEAINRKNVLKSAKFSSGGGLGQATKGDDSSFSSSNGKNRRSDDDEASYADAETEDTESSCSELEGSGNSRRLIETTSSRVTMMTHDQRDSKVETEDDDDDDDDEPAQQSAVNMEFTEMTESPLQAIYDIEVKMAYINEVCDALNERGRSDLPSRYFSRRDSEATVIEQPIEHKRTIDPEDSASITERRARNRSSSGNESDFSSNVSVGSQHNNHKSLSRETSSNNGTDTERWSMLEKKYSRSMTSVNSLGSKVEPQIPQTPQGLTPATSVPKIVKNCSTGASEVVEKKIEKIIEKSSTDGILKKTNPSIPRGRNDFKSIAEKWQSIESSSVSSPAPSRPQLATPPSTTPSILSKPSAPSPVKSSISDLKFPPRENTIPQTVTRTPSGLSSSSRDDSARIMQAKLEAMEADKAWAAEKCKSESEPQQQRVTSTGSGAGTKRSVSVNDIRKAFEKAEIAVNSYNGREGGSPTEEGTGKNKDGGLTLPAAHFRVSSFDSTTSEESGAPTPAGMYGSSNSLVSSAPKDPYGSITSLASSTSLISPQELQQLIDEANQSLEEAGTPSHEVSVVILHREISCGSLGITLAGGADYETKEITVHKVLTSSIADRDGRIHRCDRILSINGKSTKGLTHREALNLLKSPRTEVVLVVSRGRTANGFQTISETSALDRAIEPLLNGNLVIENDDDTCYKWGSLKTATLVKDGAGLGFSLEGGKGSIQGDKPLTVKKIFIGGPAEKSGELKLGDLIVSINGINMSSKSRTEAWNFMKKLNDGDVKITIRSPLV